MSFQIDGGAAFPDPRPNYSSSAKGLTLRDYFAAAALTGMSGQQIPSDRLAEYAYQIADEMIRARIPIPKTLGKK